MGASNEGELGTENGLTLPAISGGVWRTTPVRETPEIVLARWRVFSVSLPNGESCTRHFVGWNVTEREGRVSSPIVEFDSLTMRGRTRSGRVYELRGVSGWDGDAEYVWSRWQRLQASGDLTNIKDVSAELSSSRGSG